MNATTTYLTRNQQYVTTYPGPSPLQPTQHVAVVACMDSRIDVFAALGLGHGEAHIIRNAGGVITDDVERSLAISQHKLQTREIILIHHSECGLQTFTDAEFKDELEASTGVRPQWSDENFVDVDDSVRRSLQRLRTSPFLVTRDFIRGFVFDVRTGQLREIDPQ
jgi:carbonic anhydrase